MKLRWAALVLALALGAVMPRIAATQGFTQRARERSPVYELGQNYPNPFNPSTSIPFTIGSPRTCPDGGRTYRVSLRIYNLLAQVVAVPVLVAGDGANGQLVRDVFLRCGTYTAFWNGINMLTSKQAGNGVYLYSLQVEDGKQLVKKMLVR